MTWIPTLESKIYTVVLRGVSFSHLIKVTCTESDWTVQRDSVKFVFSPESVKKMFWRVHQQKGWFLLSVTGLFFFSLSHRGRLWVLGIEESLSQLFWHSSGWSMVRCKLSNRKDRYYRLDTGREKRETSSRDIARLKRDLSVSLGKRQKCVRVMELLYPFIN